MRRLLSFSGVEDDESDDEIIVLSPPKRSVVTRTPAKDVQDTEALQKKKQLEREKEEKLAQEKREAQERAKQPSFPAASPARIRAETPRTPADTRAEQSPRDWSPSRGPPPDIPRRFPAVVRSPAISADDFRPPPVFSAPKQARTVRASTSRSATAMCQQLVVWNRRVLADRFPPATVVIVVDNQLIRQMKSNELCPLISIINANATVERSRIVIVVHDDYDPDYIYTPSQLKLIVSSVVFVIKHTEEANNADQVACCRQVMAMRISEKTEMIYLTPNTNANLPKNAELAELGYIIYNTSGVLQHLESRMYEDEV